MAQKLTKNKNNSLKSVSKLKTKKVAVKQKSNLASFEILNPATFCQTRHLKLISENIMKQKMFVTSIIYNQNYYFDFFPRLKSILTSQKKIAFFVLSFKNSITFSL